MLETSRVSNLFRNSGSRYERLDHPIAMGLPLDARLFVVVMTLLQFVWLFSIWFFGISGNSAKLPSLMAYSLICGVLSLFVCGDRLSRNLVSLLESPRLRVGVLLATVLVGGIVYASHQRVWRFDEEGLFAAAKIVAEEGPAALFPSYQSRRWLGLQHPPLAPLLYGGFMATFGTSLFVARLLSVALLGGCVVLTYRIGKELYDARTGAVASAFLLSMPLVWRLGTATLVETLLVFLCSLTILLTIRFVRTERYRLIVGIGFLLGLGILVKYTMLLIAPALAAFCLISLDARKCLKIFGVAILVGIPICGAWVVYASQHDLLGKHLAFLHLGLVQVAKYDYGRELFMETMTNRLPSALGVYNLPLLALAFVGLFRRRQQRDWLLLSWIVPIFVMLSLTLPDHRYFMVLFPAFAITMAASIAADSNKVGRIVPLALALCVGSLYMFVDWERAVQLFLSPHFVD